MTETACATWLNNLEQAKPFKKHERTHTSTLVANAASQNQRHGHYLDGAGNHRHRYLRPLGAAVGAGGIGSGDYLPE